MTTLERENVVDAFDGLVARLTDAAAQGQDFLQEAISAALDVTDLDTRLRFVIGDICSLIEGKYGADEMGTFAGAIKRSKKTCYSYAQVARFFPKEERASWLAEPALSWSHLKLAMRLKNAEDAAEFLAYVADNALTVDGASIELRERMGETVRAAPLFDKPAVIRREGGRVYIEGDIYYTAIEDGQTYQIMIKPVL